MIGIELLKEKVREVTEEDKEKKLLTVSFSKLDLFDNCQFKYDLQYNKKNYVKSEAIHLDLGNLCHKVLELKGKMLKDGIKVDYEYLYDVLLNGIEEKTNKGSEKIIGTKDIKKKYGFETWYLKDNASFKNYEEKVKIFLEEVLPVELEDEKWEVFDCEKQFDFVYKYGEDKHGVPKEVIIHGFIDNVGYYKDEEGNIEGFKVTDFKTSKKKFDDKKTKTSLQQLIYGISLFNEYGILPEEYEFSFIMINEKQTANSKGYLVRGMKKLDSILNSIEDRKKENEYVPNPSPLCHWCQFCKTNPDSVEPYNSLCPYYSLWTPDAKVYTVNQPYNTSDSTSVVYDKPKTETKRKLIF